MIFPKATPMAEIESSLVYSNHVSRLEQKEMDRFFLQKTEKKFWPFCRL